MSAYRKFEWTDARCGQLVELGRLLSEVATIDRGSGCLERIAMCIELAERLRKTSMQPAAELSFFDFLRDLAWDERMAAQQRSVTTWEGGSAKVRYVRKVVP